METLSSEVPGRQQQEAREGLLCSESGSTTLEFAVAMPVVVLLVFGSMVAMLGMMAYGNATYATSFAARYAAMHSETSDSPATSDQVAAQVRTHLWLGGQQSQVSTSWVGGNMPGGSVTVTTSLNLPLAIPLTGLTQLTITASAPRLVTR